MSRLTAGKKEGSGRKKKMGKKWKGCIVEESLNDLNILRNMETVKTRVTEDEDASERWHIRDVLVNEKEINNIHERLKEGWFAHFWFDKKIIVLFRNRKFILDMNDKESWKTAIEYGLSIGIPKEQLDFKIEF